jgi:hypothetical protein
MILEIRSVISCVLWDVVLMPIAPQIRVLVW